ncbi:NdP2 protein, putative [Plasmodium vivax]|nr:NdP2 protein, putative [Plasmodium vivax]
MFLMNTIKGIFHHEEEANNDAAGEKEKKNKRVHISELKDEVWLYKSEDKKERLSEDYASEYEDEGGSFYDEEGGRKPKDHFLEVPLFDEDESGRSIQKNLRSLPSRKIKAIKRSEESEVSEESLSTTDEEEDMEEPFLDLYEELKREQSVKEFYNPMLRPRLWRFEFFIKYIHNLENQLQRNFYLVSFGNIKKLKLYGDLKKEVLYTPGYSVEPGEVKYLKVPLPIWAEKELSISYEDLQNFEVAIEMWCIKGFIFNELYASSKKTLKEVIENDPDTNIILRRRIEKRNITFEAQRLGVYMQLSEIFEFHMALDSWWFIANSEMPSYLKTLPKILRFKFPLSEDDWVIHSSHKSQNNFWLYPGYFCFIGTYHQLANAFFILTVLSHNTSYRYKPPILLGSCIISLKSVTEHPFFKGTVKKLTLDKTKFRQGEIVGNIKCFVNSYGIEEGDIPVQRPVQPLSDATLVNQLVLNDHYLVIRVIKCENLAISSIDLNNVNINVWVKWDGIVNKTDTVSKSTSPFFYQNLYFPIRLVDKKELTHESLIKNVLPVDLISKGEICFEVHNNNEVNSTILGIFELPFADIFNYGTPDYRSLAQEASQSSSPYNDYKDNYDAANEGADLASDNYDDYYVRKYKTVVYKNTLELMYSTLHLKALNMESIQTKKESTISVEAFVIPPLPSGLVFVEKEKIQNASMIYKSMSKRWERDFAKFKDTYTQWFPRADKSRSFPCVSRNEFDGNHYPLCSFVTSINLPAQVSTPGPLFHWLNNIEYIENEDESSIFTPPYFFLSYKKGTIQDHVLLLCCCLKGLEYDAYVCKGTINNGKKNHYWVMTRHEDGWVCFWEVTNKCIIHLKRRWNNSNFSRNAEVRAQEEMISKVVEGNDRERYYTGDYLMSFVRYGLEELKKREKQIKEEYDLKEQNKLYTMELYRENHMKDEQVDVNEVLYNDEELFNNMFEVKFEKHETYSSSKALKYLLENFSKHIPIAPKMFLLDYESTLAYVPYSSVEVVFNDEQLYGNLQNHHPACILYDLENNFHWRPLLNHSPVPIKSEITISTPLSDRLSVKYTKDLEEEIQEMILFMRTKEGLDTSFEHSKEIRHFLEMYIDLCEYKLNLDNNYNTKPENYDRAGGGEAAAVGGKAAEVGQAATFGGEDKAHLHLRKTWSQYKNDYYPNIEAQYVNKENLNFYETYHPSGHNEMISHEQKKHLANIPEDYIYGMNDEVYTQGKEQYIKNYVFCRDSADILNNYDSSVKRKNVKRFSNAPVHYQERVHAGGEAAMGEAAMGEAAMGEAAMGEAAMGGVEMESVTRSDSRSDTNDPPGKEPQLGGEKNQEEDIPSISGDGSIQEGDPTSEANAESKRRPRCTDRADVPNKYIKKYNKRYDGLLKLEKSLKKKEKQMKEEMMDVKLGGEFLQRGRLGRQSFFSYVDTQAFLKHTLGRKTRTKKGVNKSVHEKRCVKCDHLFNGYLIIPSKGDHSGDGTEGRCNGEGTQRGRRSGDGVGPSYRVNESSTTRRSTLLRKSHPSGKKLRELVAKCKKRYCMKKMGRDMLKLKVAFLRRRIRGNGKGRSGARFERNPFVSEKKAEDRKDGAASSPDREVTGALQRGRLFLCQSHHQMYADQKFLDVGGGPTGAYQGTPQEMVEQSSPDNPVAQNRFADYNASDMLRGNNFQGTFYEHVQGKNTNEGLGGNVNMQTGGEHLTGLTKSKEKAPTPIPPKTWSRLNPTSKYAAHQISQWNWYYSLEEQYFNWQYYKFPVPPNHTFVGFPIHFSTIDFYEVKSFLLHSKRFENIMKLSIDNISFLIYCKVFPLIGGIMSNWMFLGCLVPWMTAQERETKMKKPPKKDINQR